MGSYRPAARFPETMAHLCANAGNPWAYAETHFFEIESDGDDDEFVSIRFADTSIVTFDGERRLVSCTIAYDVDPMTGGWQAPRLRQQPSRHEDDGDYRQ